MPRSSSQLDASMGSGIARAAQRLGLGNNGDEAVGSQVAAIQRKLKKEQQANRANDVLRFNLSQELSKAKRGMESLRANHNARCAKYMDRNSELIIALRNEMKEKQALQKHVGKLEAATKQNKVLYQVRLHELDETIQRLEAEIELLTTSIAPVAVSSVGTSPQLEVGFDSMRPPSVAQVQEGGGKSALDARTPVKSFNSPSPHHDYTLLPQQRQVEPQQSQQQVQRDQQRHLSSASPEVHSTLNITAKAHQAHANSVTWSPYQDRKQAWADSEANQYGDDIAFDLPANLKKSSRATRKARQSFDGRRGTEAGRQALRIIEDDENKSNRGTESEQNLMPEANNKKPLETFQRRLVRPSHPGIVHNSGYVNLHRKHSVDMNAAMLHDDNGFEDVSSSFDDDHGNTRVLDDGSEASLFDPQDSECWMFPPSEADDIPLRVSTLEEVRRQSLEMDIETSSSSSSATIRDDCDRSSNSRENQHVDNIASGASDHEHEPSPPSPQEHRRSRPRRRSSLNIASFAEPSLRSKLRQGDAHTFGDVSSLPSSRHVKNPGVRYNQIR